MRWRKYGKRGEEQEGEIWERRVSKWESKGRVSRRNDGRGSKRMGNMEGVSWSNGRE